MADERTEDLSELEGDAVHERLRELMDDGWQPATLTLRRTDSSEEEGVVLRDEPKL